MQKWEYLVMMRDSGRFNASNGAVYKIDIDNPYHYVRMFNELGSEGWEMVAITPNSMSIYWASVVFKRLRP